MPPPTGTALSGNELTWYNLDKPMFLPLNALFGSHSSSKWQQTADLGGATDRTDASYPTIRARDLHGIAQTSPSTGSTVYYFWANVTGAYDIDCVCILGHNFNSIAATSVDFILSTDALFDTGANSRTVKTWSSPGAGRLASTALYHTGSTPMRYTGVTYAAIKITCGSSQIPRFTELWFGTRYQFPYNPNVVWTPGGPLYSNVRTVTTEIGATTIYTKSTHQRKITAEWSLANTSANDTVVSAMRSQTGNMSRPFLFWEKPYSTQAQVYCMYNPEAEWRWELVGPTERVFTLPMVEIAPFYTAGQ